MGHPTFLPLPPLLTASRLRFSDPAQCGSLPGRSPPAACLPARAAVLLEQQRKHPLFDVLKSPPELAAPLSRLQAAGAFAALPDLPEVSAAARAADAIRRHATPAIEVARAEVVAKYPGIDGPGGALYPEHRAHACWRDLSEFSRVVAYGVACGREVFSERGSEVMKEVYQVLNVPVDPMRMAVARVGREIAEREEDVEVKVLVGGGFADLLELLERF